MIAVDSYVQYVLVDNTDKKKNKSGDSGVEMDIGIDTKQTKMCTKDVPKELSLLGKVKYLNQRRRPMTTKTTMEPLPFTYARTREILMYHMAAVHQLVLMSW